MNNKNTYTRRATDLKLGESSVIDRFEGNAFSSQFLEIGCLPKSPIRLIRKDPAGRAMYLKINGQAFAFRREEANHIILKY